MSALVVSACGSSSKSSSSSSSGGSSSSSGSTSSKGPIVIAGLEGPAAQGGPDFMDGMRVAAHLINQSGGVDGRQIQLKIIQTGGTPQGTASAYRAAAQDSATIGDFLGAAGALAIRGLSPQVKLPTVVASGNYNVIQPVSKYMFENSFGNEYASSSVNYAVTHLHVKKIAVIHYETDFSSQLAPAVQTACKQLGCTVTDVESSTSTASVDQLTPLLTKMKATNPDAYYIESLNPNAMKAAHSLGMFSKPVIAEQWLSTPALAAACGTNCETVVFGAHKCRLTSLDELQASDPLRSFCKTYIGQFQSFFPGKPFELFSIYGRDSVYTFAEAAKLLAAAKKPITRDNIATQLENLHGEITTSHGAVNSSPTNHRLTGTWHQAYIDTVIKMNGATPTYHLAPMADPSGSHP